MTSFSRGDAEIVDQPDESYALETVETVNMVDAGGAIVLAGMSAISGAVVGFILAGAFDAAFYILPTALAAGYLGWRTRALL